MLQRFLSWNITTQKNCDINLKILLLMSFPDVVIMYTFGDCAHNVYKLVCYSRPKLYYL